VGDAGVVDEDIEAGEFAADRAGESVDGMGIADVAGVSEDANLGGAQFPAEAMKGLLVAGGQDQVAAFGG